MVLHTLAAVSITADITGRHCVGLWVSSFHLSSIFELSVMIFIPIAYMRRMVREAGCPVGKAGIQTLASTCSTYLLFTAPHSCFRISLSWGRCMAPCCPCGQAFSWKPQSPACCMCSEPQTPGCPKLKVGGGAR